MLQVPGDDQGDVSCLRSLRHDLLILPGLQMDMDAAIE